MEQIIAFSGRTGTNFITRLQKRPVCKRINTFLLSPYYFFLIGALTVLASVFSAELVVYSIFILIGLYISFCGRDYLALIPIVICCYISPSIGNNPGKSESSIFYGESGIYLVCIAVLFALSLIMRLCIDPEFGGMKFLRAKRKLLPGMLILGGAYLLGGAFSGHYFDHGMSNILFAFIQFVSIFGMYYLFTGAVNWHRARRGYLAWTGLCVGFSILFQLGYIYITNDVIVEGVIQRERIYSGWGNYNNMGAMLAMMIPFAFQLATIRRRNWIYHLCALSFVFGTIFTCSRSAILVSAVIYMLSCGLLVYKDLHTKSSLVMHFVTLSLVLLLLLFFHDALYHLFQELIERGMNPSNRDEIYKEGMKQFLKFPIFGGSFYPTDYIPFDFSEIEAFSSFFPPRWHNTVVQILASCGAVGMAAYLYHRVETAKMFLQKQFVGKAFIAISILTLLGTSLLDCHLFNVGPALFYSMALAFAEKADIRLDSW